MSWKSALKKVKLTENTFFRPVFPLAAVDVNRLVTIDFETYFDVDYTLRKMSTSEYVRDKRFKAQIMALKIGNKPTRVIPAKRIKAELGKINWKTHSVLCHNTQFDGFILSHHYDVVPVKYYDTLSMARGLHSNEVGGSLDDVAKFYGGVGKIEGVLERTKGVLDWPKELYEEAAGYCAQDNDECYRIFWAMHPKMPADEMDLIDLTIRMFCDPFLKVNLPRVEAELKRELDHREKLFYAALDPTPYYDDKNVLKTRAERALVGKERDMLIIKRVIGSNEKFADMLRAENVEPPVKISAAWIKRTPQEKLDTEDEKYTYAFAKDDIAFTSIPEKVEVFGAGLDPNNIAHVPKLVARQERLRALIECRLAVKSTTNITRAERFLTAGAGGLRLPVGYAYFRAHTGRWGGNNKMNMQNLTRGGELRLSIEAPVGYKMAVADSGQIEARVNAWLWGQTDLLDAFRKADTWDKAKGVAKGADRDAYCRFGDDIYDREITTLDKTERFVGKVCVLGLGFQMGAAKLQVTLAKGALGGPPVFFTLLECQKIVDKYRSRNRQIVKGWSICNKIIDDMARGRTGSHGPISWEANRIWLPNGMCLKYPDLHQSLNDHGYEEWSYQAGDMRSKIYGGLLCENIVQALARIIVGWQMLQISRKYRVVMTTHDEIVTAPSTAQAAACFKFMEKWMRTPPTWCADIPLNVEGGYAQNYSK